MFFISEWYVLPAAFVLDMLIGDPRFFPHPVRWMGKGIERLEPWFRENMSGSEIAGLFFAVTLIFLAWAVAAGAFFLAFSLNGFLGSVLEIIIVYYCISTLSLKRAAMDVSKALAGEGLGVARKRLSFIVGRDVSGLDEEGVSRAAFETVAENLVDGIISPLFWAGIGGAPFAVVYKMINTLDSMVGYKNEKYREFGMISAKIDDFANYLPARLSVLIIPAAAFLLSFDFRQAFRTAVTDGRNHSSPNAGFPEAAFSGAVGVKLGGPSVYGDRVVVKSWIGEDFRPVVPGDIQRGCRLMVCSAWLMLGFSMVVAHLSCMIFVV